MRQYKFFTSVDVDNVMYILSLLLIIFLKKLLDYSLLVLNLMCLYIGRNVIPNSCFNPSLGVQLAVILFNRYPLLSW